MRIRRTTKPDHGIRNTGPWLASRRARTVAACLGAVTAQSVLAGSALGQGCVPTSSWGLDRIDQRLPLLDGEFCPTSSGAGVNVYVVGSGLRYTHVDFGGRANLFYDYRGGQGLDCNGDGTFMGSLAAGSEFGIAKSASVQTVRVGDCIGAIADPDLVVGLTMIALSGQLPGVVVLPAASCDAAVNGAIQLVIDEGYSVIVPAGNDGTDFCNPSCTPTVVPLAIVVGATDDADCRALYSNYGPGVDIFAPGADVSGAGNASDFGSVTLTGDTAYAAAYVAGVVAEYLGVNPLLMPAAVQDLVLSRSTPISGCGESMRLAYTGLDDHPVPPPAPVVCDPCPMCTGPGANINQALTAGIVGPVNGTDWSWQITADVPGDFDDTAVVLVPGVTTDYNGDGFIDELDVAHKWADSINAYFTSQGCDTTSVTGQVWATAQRISSTAYLSISSKCPFTIFVSDTSDPSTPVCDLGDIFDPCSFNPTAESFPGSGTDCNLNGFDDFFDTTFGLSPDTNLNAIPDECEGLHPEQTALGVTMQSFGNAFLTQNGTGGIVISNMGESGLDGFVTTTGPVRRLDLQLGEWANAAIGATMRSTAQNAVDATLMSVDMVRTADGIDLTPDYAAVGASNFVFEVYDKGQLVASQVVNASSGTTSASSSSWWPISWYVDAHADSEGNHTLTGCLRWGSSASVQMPSGDPVVGDSLRMTTVLAAPLDSGLHRLDTHLSNMSSLTVPGASLGQFGNEHVALGNTVMSGGVNPNDPGDPSLIISELGSSGTLDPSLRWRVQQYNQSASSSINVTTLPISLAGADQGITLRSRGCIGTDLTDLGIASLASTGGASANVDADFSALGSATTRVAVYDQGAFVGETVVPGGGPVGTVTTAGGGDLFVSGCGKLPGQLPCFILDFPQDIIFAASNPFAGAAPLEGDEIRIIANEPSAPVDALESLEFEGENIDTITVIDETFGDVTPDCPGDIDGSGDVGFTDLTALLGAWGPCGAGPCPADLDGDGQVGFTDLTTLLGAWGPCA